MRSTLRNLRASDKKRSHGLEMGRLQVQVLRLQGLQNQENLEMNIWNHDYTQSFSFPSVVFLGDGHYTNCFELIN